MEIYKKNQGLIHSSVNQEGRRSTTNSQLPLGVDSKVKILLRHLSAQAGDCMRQGFTYTLRNLLDLRARKFC